MVNRVTLLGNLGSDPEVKHLENTSIASFSLATTEKYKDRNGNKVENVEWHNCVVWGNLAKVVEEYVLKGSKVYVEGKIKTEKYEDKNGNTKYSTKIIVNNLVMLDSNPNTSSNSEQQNNTSQNTNSDYSDNNPQGGIQEEDDLPF